MYTVKLLPPVPLAIVSRSLQLGLCIVQLWFEPKTPYFGSKGSIILLTYQSNQECSSTCWTQCRLNISGCATVKRHECISPLFDLVWMFTTATTLCKRLIHWTRYSTRPLIPISTTNSSQMRHMLLPWLLASESHSKTDCWEKLNVGSLDWHISGQGCPALGLQLCWTTCAHTLNVPYYSIYGVL